MFDLPLHPAFVHLPLGLCMVLPMLSFLFLVLLKDEKFWPKVWAPILLLQLGLTGAVYLAAEMGDDQAKKVEKVVSEKFIEEHEESADQLLIATIVSLVISAGSFYLQSRKPKSSSRWVSLVAQVAVLGMAMRVGHSGGSLVYKHNAGSAYLTRPSAADALQAVPAGAVKADYDDVKDDDKDEAGKKE